MYRLYFIRNFIWHCRLLVKLFLEEPACSTGWSTGEGCVATGDMHRHTWECIVSLTLSYLDLVSGASPAAVQRYQVIKI